MSERDKISGIARRFVERKLEQFRKDAGKGCGLYYELYSQNFSDAVDALASKVKRDDLHSHIRVEVEKSGDYVPSTMGRWKYDHELEDVRFCPAERPAERLLSRVGRIPEKGTEEKHIKATDRGRPIER